MKFKDIYGSLEQLNERKNELMPSIDDLTSEEYVALIGRYAESNIRYSSVIQFEAAFLTTMKESLEKLRAKLKINARLRTMEEAEALKDESRIVNSATNPDTIPPTDTDEILGYINAQQTEKGKLSPVRGLYNWKHSVGGQAYNEFLDSFRYLFRVILFKEEVVYGQ